MALVLLATATAQQQPGQTPSLSDADEPLQTLSVDVNVVNIFFNVKDRRGALISSLNQDEFSIFEDGKPQVIKYFAAEANLPLTLGMLIDTSVSQERVLSSEREVGAAFLREVLRPKDLAFLISFDVNVDLLQDLTASVDMLRDGLNRTRVNSGGGGGSLPGMGGGPFPGSNVPKGTLLYDAIYLATREKLASEVGRKAMIILTDGADQGSRSSLQDAIESAQKADVMTYVILIADRGFYGGLGYSGDRDMKRLAEQCGGRLIEVGNKQDKLREAFSQIAAELRSQYSIGYTPTNTARDGKFRQVEIRTKSRDYRVQARTGYFAPGLSR
ncbi:MAG: VWA domain-containing protein [Candidatus Korobacteraceae bacterium]